MIKIKSNGLRWALSLIFVTGIAVLVTIIGVLDSQDSNSRLTMVTSPESKPEGDWRGVSVYVNLSSIEPELYEYQLHISFRPSQWLIDSNNTIGGVLTRDIKLTMDDQTITFFRGSIMQSQDLKFQFSKGDFNQYPFDYYQGDFILTVSLIDDGAETTSTMVDASNTTYTSNTTDSSRDFNNIESLINFDTRSENIPIYFQLAGAIHGWRVEHDYLDLDGDKKHFGISIEAKRSKTSVAFSIYIIVVMWALSICVFALSMTFHLTGKKVIPHAIGLCTGMLFALPNIRSTQPGLPPIGCTADIMGFFWNIFLVAIAGISLLATFVYQSHYSPDTDEKKDTPFP